MQKLCGHLSRFLRACRNHLQHQKIALCEKALVVARAIKVQPPKYRLFPQEREIADFRITCLSAAAAASLEVVHSDVPASLNQAGNITYQREGCQILI